MPPRLRRPARGRCLPAWRRRRCRGSRRAICATLAAQFFERALGDQPAARDDADPVGHALGHFQNMRGHDHGGAGARAFAQHVLDLAGGAGVEPGERLVENDQPRRVNERAGERHLLAHALGKCFATLARMRAEPEPAEQILRACLRQPWLDAPQPGDEFQIFLRRELVVDHRLVGYPGDHALGFDRIGERVDAGDMDRAGVRPDQTGDHAQRRGLAGAIWAKQRIELAGADAQIEAIDRRALEALDEAADVEGER